MRASQFINEALDTDAVNELDSFIMNDEDLYRRRFMPIISNIKRKMNRKKDDYIKNDLDKDLDTIEFDVEPKYDEKVNVDIEKFKSILKKKFKNKNYDKILIKYGLYDNEKYDNDTNKKISKNMMNDIIKEIMLN